MVAQCILPQHLGVEGATAHDDDVVIGELITDPDVALFQFSASSARSLPCSEVRRR